MTILAVEAATTEDRWEFAFLIIAALLFLGAREAYERYAGVGRHEAGEDPSPTPPGRTGKGGSSRSRALDPHGEPGDEPLDEPSFEPPPLRGAVAEEARRRLRVLGLALTGKTEEPAEEEQIEEEEETVEEYAVRMAEMGLSIGRTARGIQDHWGYSESHAKRLARAARNEIAHNANDGGGNE